jgi:2,4-didehydro-3-deoxy-L-rhamnonate hydrolase
MADDIFHLGVYAIAGRSTTMLVLDDHLLDLEQAAGRADLKLPSGGIRSLLEDWNRSFETLTAIAAHARAAGIEIHGLKPEEGRPLPPLGSGGKQLCAAANYRDHVAGMRKTFTPSQGVADEARPLPPLRPYMFGKLAAPTGAFDDIAAPAGIERTDWEAELMVVIGRSGRNIPQAKAADHIAGYMTFNDVSCRDLTWREDRPAIRSDWLAGKSFDTFSPTGPWLTPAAFIPDHADLFIRLWVNGEIKQDGNSRDMTFGIEEQIEYASRLMTLSAGDTIATGTPAGTGQERLEFLKVGDIVETEVQYCGRQRNRIIAGPSEYIRG